MRAENLFQPFIIGLLGPSRVSKGRPGAHPPAAPLKPLEEHTEKSPKTRIIMLRIF